MEHGDAGPPLAGDLSAYRRVRQERTADALICLFSQVLGKPLERRELTDAERARRQARTEGREILAW